MTISEFNTLLTTSTLNIPIAYSHFNKETELPYLVYYETGTENSFADNKTYGKVKDIEIELYTELKDVTLEEQLETLLNNNEIPFEKLVETYIDDEKMYEQVYQITLY